MSDPGMRLHAMLNRIREIRVQEERVYAAAVA